MELLHQIAEITKPFVMLTLTVLGLIHVLKSDSYERTTLGLAYLILANTL